MFEAIYYILRQNQRVLTWLLPLPIIGFSIGFGVFGISPDHMRFGILFLSVWSLGFLLLVWRYPSAVLDHFILAVIVTILAIAIPVLSPFFAQLNNTQKGHALIWPSLAMMLIWLFLTQLSGYCVLLGKQRSYRFMCERDVAQKAEHVFDALKLTSGSGNVGVADENGRAQIKATLFEILSQTYLNRPLFDPPDALGEGVTAYMRIVDECLSGAERYQIFAVEHLDPKMPKSVETMRVIETESGSKVQFILDIQLTRLGALTLWLENYLRKFLDCLIDHHMDGVLRYNISPKRPSNALVALMDGAPPPTPR